MRSVEEIYTNVSFHFGNFLSAGHKLLLLTGYVKQLLCIATATSYRTLVTGNIYL
jgi:hypothetical protein